MLLIILIKVMWTESFKWFLGQIQGYVWLCKLVASNSLNLVSSELVSNAFYLSMMTETIFEMISRDLN